ncbi:MAG: heparinase II/III family protein [Alphaproteobacteria bacterium]
MRPSRRRFWAPGPRHAIERALFRSPLYRLTLKGHVPDQLATVPTDPWVGDTARGVRLLDGIWTFAGQTFVGVDAAPWYPVDASPAWLEAMHGFAWLRDSREVGQAARVRARAGVANWIARCAAWHPVAWRADVVARRVVAWLANANFLLNGADVPFRRRFLGSLAEQTRHLTRIARGAPEGLPRLAALESLALAELCLPGALPRLPATLRLIDAELRRQILPDGGHVSRNPSALLAALRDTAGLRAALLASGQAVPEGVKAAIDRMAPMLRLFRHGDGGLALFNGGGEEEPSVIDATLALAQAPAKPSSHAAASGFVRLAARRSVVLVDAGAPAPGVHGAGAHAGIGSFEFSVGADRVVVNCGAYQGPDRAWATALRATAAHSSVTVDDTNACELLDDGMGRAPVEVAAERIEDGDASGVEVRHDGYRARFKLDHVRRLALAEDGQRLAGEDRLIGPGGERYAVRFHLHPAVSAALLEDGSAVLVRLPAGGGWRFAADAGVLSVAESVYLGGGGAVRRTRQMVVVGGLNGSETVIRWELAAVPTRSERRGRAVTSDAAPGREGRAGAG